MRAAGTPPAFYSSGTFPKCTQAHRNKSSRRVRRALFTLAGTRLPHAAAA
ncbi:MAG: hypothetical protein FJY29_10345 [Betaproteobacteria bacterium]|nr:hypothetical protein [Betaproteobacteria bacterium]